MPRPSEWHGSDMRSRAEVVQWLHDHGTDVHDESGLMVGRMRTELGKGRALSQLLLEMENDGMIQREVKGRRTYRINLVDDWGLTELTGAIGYREPVRKRNDLDALVETLRATVAMLGDQLVLAREAEAAQREQAELMRETLSMFEAEAEQKRSALWRLRRPDNEKASA